MDNWEGRRGVRYGPYCAKLPQGQGDHGVEGYSQGLQSPLYVFDLRKAYQKDNVRYPQQTVTARVYYEQIMKGTLAILLWSLRRRIPDILVVKDNAPVHVQGPAGRDRHLCGIPSLEHPPSLPDLFPIENVWLSMKPRMRTLERQPTNMVELEEVLVRLWDETPQEEVDRHIDSMLECRETVLDNGGWQTGW